MYALTISFHAKTSYLRSESIKLDQLLTSNPKWIWSDRYRNSTSKSIMGQMFVVLFDIPYPGTNLFCSKKETI